jgi:hypothetical protein
MRLADFERDFLAFADRANSGRRDEPAEYRYAYVLVIARTLDTLVSVDEP